MRPGLSSLVDAAELGAASRPSSVGDSVNEALRRVLLLELENKTRRAVGRRAQVVELTLQPRLGMRVTLEDGPGVAVGERGELDGDVANELAHVAGRGFADAPDLPDFSANDAEPPDDVVAETVIGQSRRVVTTAVRA